MNFRHNYWPSESRIKILILIILNSVLAINVFSQCKDISIGKKQIDNELLNEYDKINADTFLVINYGNEFLKYKGWALIATINKGQLKAYKYRLLKNDRIKRKEIKKKSILSHLDYFITDSLWKIKDEIYYDPKIVVFHPKRLKIHYSDKKTNWCRYFERLNGLTKESYSDKRVIWIEELVKKI